MGGKTMTLTHYVGGKLVGITVDFPPSLNYPENTTFINSETFEEFILVAGVWQKVGVPTEFKPSDIAGLKEWLDAGVGITASLGIVSNWADQSGQGNDVSQGVENSKPFLDQNAINSLPAVSFDGIDDFMTLTAFTGGLIASGFSIYIVVKTSPITGKMIFDAITTRALSDVVGGNHSFFNGLNLTSGTAPDNAYHIMVFVFDGASSEMLRDEISLVTGNAGSSGMSGLNLGSDSGGGSNSEITIAEFLIYDSVLSAEDNTTLINFLKDKYGL